MKQDLVLEAGEAVRWDGRPAPRCFTFRHWRHSVFGCVFLAICIVWQVLGTSMAEEYGIPWLIWLPMPFVLIGVYLSAGHLLQARLEWNNVYYAITDRRLLTQRGLWRLHTDELQLKDITYFSLYQQGDELGTLRVYKGKEKQLILHCLEHPRRATDLLEEVLKPDEAQDAIPGAQETQNEALDVGAAE